MGSRDKYWVHFYVSAVINIKYCPTHVLFVHFMRWNKTDCHFCSWNACVPAIKIAYHHLCRCNLHRLFNESLQIHTNLYVNCHIIKCTHQQLLFKTSRIWINVCIVVVEKQQLGVFPFSDTSILRRMSVPSDVMRMLQNKKKCAMHCWCSKLYISISLHCNRIELIPLLSNKTDDFHELVNGVSRIIISIIIYVWYL